MIIDISDDATFKMNYSETSDREELCKNLLKTCPNESHCLEFYHISFARVAKFGPYCCIIAWNIPGESMGSIHVYHAFATDTIDQHERGIQKKWILIGIIKSQCVGKRSAAVTDIIPLNFRNDNENKFCFVSSRVNGCVEFAMLPQITFKGGHRSVKSNKRVMISFTQSLYSLSNIASENPIHDTFAMEIYQDKLWQDRALIFLSGQSLTSSSIAVSAWMVVSNPGHAKPVSMLNVGKFCLPSIDLGISSFISCPSSRKSMPYQTMRPHSKIVSLFPLEMSISSNGEFLAILDLNGGIALFECSNLQSTSFEAVELFPREFGPKLEPGDFFLKASWSRTNNIIAVSSKGVLRIFDPYKRRILYSSNYATAWARQVSETVILAVCKQSSRLSIITANQLSPEISVEQMIVHKKVDEAHKMVIDYDIRDDKILKALWEVTLSTNLLQRSKNMIAKHITETILGRISDNEYVEDQALNTHVDSVEAMKAMLDDGFNRAIKRGNLEICLELKNRRSRLVSFSRKICYFLENAFLKSFVKRPYLNIRFVAHGEVISTL